MDDAVLTLTPANRLLDRLDVAALTFLNALRTKFGAGGFPRKSPPFDGMRLLHR